MYPVWTVETKTMQMIKHLESYPTPKEAMTAAARALLGMGGTSIQAFNVVINIDGQEEKGKGILVEDPHFPLGVLVQNASLVGDDSTKLVLLNQKAGDC